MIAILIPLPPFSFFLEACLQNINETIGLPAADFEVVFLTNGDPPEALMKASRRAVYPHRIVRYPLEFRRGIHLELLDKAFSDPQFPEWLLVQHADMFWAADGWGRMVQQCTRAEKAAWMVAHESCRHDVNCLKHKFSMGGVPLDRAHDFAGLYNRRWINGLGATFRWGALGTELPVSKELERLIDEEKICWLNPTRPVRRGDALDGSDLIGLEIAARGRPLLGILSPEIAYLHSWDLFHIANDMEVAGDVLLVRRREEQCVRSLHTYSWISSHLFPLKECQNRIFPWKILQSIARRRLLRRPVLKRHKSPLCFLLEKYRREEAVLGNGDLGIKAVRFQDKEYDLSRSGLRSPAVISRRAEHALPGRALPEPQESRSPCANHKPAAPLDGEPVYPKKLQIRPSVDWPHHYAGWSFCVEALRCLNNQYGYLLVDSVETAAVRDQNITRPWVGFCHNVPHHPPLVRKVYGPINDLDLEKLFASPFWKRSAPLCRGLFFLSEYARKFAEMRIPTAVASVLHPSPAAPFKFDYEKFARNPNRRLFMVGHWLRNFQSFYDLKSDRFSKSLLVLPSTVVNYRALFENVRTNDSVELISRLSNADYDKTLSENVVFLDLFDSSANNVVLECIMRSTPLLINRLPALEEYLGRDYPLFYSCRAEAEAHLADDSSIQAAARYLDSIDKCGFSGTRFRESFCASPVYAALKVFSLE